MKIFTPRLSVRILFIALSLAAIILYSYQASAQNSGRTLLERTNEIKESPSSTIPAYVSFNDNEGPLFNNFEQWFRINMKLSSDFGLMLINEEKDKLGFTHYRYRQTFHSLPVSNTMLLVHVKDNQVVSFNGETVSEISEEVVPAVSESAALADAMKFVGAKSYKWQIPQEEAFIKREQGNSNATFFPNGELMFAKAINGDYKLAYCFDIYAQNPVSRKYVYVDAASGEILSSEDRIHETNTTGTAVTAYCGTQSITTDYTGTTYRLRETTRGLGVETYNMHLDTNYAASTDFTDADNTWNNVNAAKDQYATDAHFGAEKTYDYYFNNYARNSIDNAGMKLRGYMHANLVVMGFGDNINAFWDGTRMTYGDGGSGYNPLTSVDITAHEITHGLTEHTANFIYAYEGGALHEGFSDIFGTAIEFFATPAQADWLIGEDIGAAFRSMSNPNSYNQPDTYRGNSWYYGQGDNGGAHQNDGVLNYWFYILTQGGTGVNDLGLSYNVTGIGMTKAAAIAYRALTVYLSPGSQYADARFYAIKSAEDLYGVCSAEAIATAAAWYAVGVGNLAAGSAPTVVTAGGVTNFCNGSSLILNASPAANYQWYKNSVSIAGATNSSYAATTSASYRVSTNYCSTNYTSSSVALTAVTAGVSISSPSTLSCNGSSILLSATATTGYNLQWKKNGVAISGATSATYTATQTGNYTATLTGTTVPSSVFNSSGAVSIPNYTCSGVNNTITVSGLATAINPFGISLFLNITHPHDSDLVVWLETPAGDKLGLAFMNGGTNGANYTSTTFSDAAFNQLPFIGAPFTGTFKPMPSTFTICNIVMNKTSFASLGNGIINPNGAWKLHIVDIRLSNTGTLNNWQLTFPGSSNPSPNCGPITSNQLAITITNAVAPTITTTGSTTFCQGGSVNLTASSGASYIWSTGAATQTINATTSGSFTVTVTSTTGCIGTASASTTQNAAVNTLVNSTYSSNGCTLAPATFAVANAYAAYLWSTGETMQSIVANNFGTYYVTITSSNGCTGVGYGDLPTIPPPQPPTITVQGLYCGSTNVTLGTTTSYNTYLWNTGATTSTINVTSSGFYTLTVTIPGGCETYADTTITFIPGVTLSVVGTNPTCGASPNGTATTNPSNAPAPYSFQWNNAGTTSTITGLSAGSYNVIVIASNGCSATSGVTLTQTASTLTQPGAITVTGGSSAVCPGDARTYSIVAVNGAASYTWTAPNGGTVTSGQGTASATVTYSSAFTTTGTLSVVAVNSCTSSVPRTLSVLRNNPSQPSLITGQITGVCAGATKAYSVTSVSGISYQWSVSSTNASISSGQGTNAVTITYNGTFSSATLSVIATNGCSNSTARTVAISSVPGQPSVVTGQSTGVCAGSVFAYSITNVAGLTYNWSSSTTNAIISSGQGTNAVTVTYVSAFTTGTLSVTGTNGCGTGIARTLSVLSVPAVSSAITVAGGIAAVCPGDARTYTATVVSSATYYTWTVPAGATITSGQGTNVINVLYDAAFTTSGIISVTATNGCGTGTAKTLTVGRYTPAQPSVITGPSSAVCATTVQNYSVTNVSGMVYTWSCSTTNASITGGQGTNAVTVTFNNLFTSCVLSVTAGFNCGASIARTLSIISKPSQPAAVSGQSTGICSATNPYSVAALSGVTYSWSTNVVGAVLVQGAAPGNTFTVTWPQFSSGLLNVTPSNACGVGTTRSLNVYGYTSTPATITGPASVCANADYTYTASALVGAVSYAWTLPAGATFVGSSTTQSVTVHIASSGGSITAKGVNACGNGGAKTLAVAVSCRIEEDELETMQLYPNPTEQQVHIVIPSQYENAVMTLINELGQTQKTIDINPTELNDASELVLDVSGFAAGMYQVVLRTRNDMETLRFVKQ